MILFDKFFTKPKPNAEMIRLHKVEILTTKLVKLLDDGQVDYELVEQLKGLLNG